MPSEIGRERRPRSERCVRRWHCSISRKIYMCQSDTIYRTRHVFLATRTPPVVVPLQCRFVHYRGTYRQHSGNRRYSAVLTQPIVPICPKRNHRRYIRKSALLNRRDRRTTTVYFLSVAPHVRHGCRRRHTHSLKRFATASGT